MKILLVLNEIKCSGVSKIICWLSNALAEKGHEVVLYTFMGKEDFYHTTENVKRIKDYIEIENRFFRTLKLIQHLGKIVSDYNIEIAVAFSPITSLALICSCIGRKTKVVVAERNDPYLDNSKMATFCRKMFFLADGAVFQSKGAANYFPKMLQNKSIVVFNPVENVDNVKDYCNRAKILVHVSRLENHQKRQDVLLNTFAIVHNKFPEYKLLIYGEGKDLDELVKIARQLEISNSVCFCGQTNHTSQAIQDGKVFIFSSDFEGMPNVLLESIASGTPVVTTDYSPGGARELIEENSCGYVARRGDPEDLANKVCSLLGDEETLLAMSKNSLEASKKYSYDSISCQWEKFLEITLNN